MSFRWYFVGFVAGLGACSGTNEQFRHPDGDEEVRRAGAIDAMTRHPAVVGANKIAALNYQHCGGLSMTLLGSEDPSAKGISIVGTHPNGVGKKRKVKTADVPKLLASHFYHKQYKGARLPASCFAGVNVDKTPTIYDYGGKPAFVKDQDVLKKYYETKKLEAPADEFYRPRLDFLADAGSGVSGQLGIDCSGFVMSSFALGGLRIRKASPAGGNDPHHALGADFAFHATGGAEGKALDARIDTIDEFMDYQLRDGADDRLKKIFQESSLPEQSQSVMEVPLHSVDAPVESDLTEEDVEELHGAEAKYAKVRAAEGADFTDTGARAFMTGAAWGLTCFQSPRFALETPVRTGDVIANRGHVVLVSRAGSDPYRMDKIRARAQPAIDAWRKAGAKDRPGFYKKMKALHCGVGAMNHSTWDFDILQSSPVSGGVGVDQMRIGEYMDTGAFTSLKVFAARTCAYQLGRWLREGDSDALTSWKNDHSGSGIEFSSRSSEIAIQRHLLTPDCKGEALKAMNEECLESCTQPQTR